MHKIFGSFLPPSSTPSLAPHLPLPTPTQQKLFCPYHKFC
jgi:hypothetical protein